MLGHGETEPHREVGGVLLGTISANSGSHCTLLEDIVPALLAVASATHLTFTHETWVQIHRDIDSREDGLVIAGWYHTHPGFGPFYSAHDMFIHRNFFADPGHIGVVLDPVHTSISVFGWFQGEVRKLPGCLVHAAEDDHEELDALLQKATYA